MSQWLSTRPQVTTTTPAKATVGGLSGYTLDVRVSSAAGSLCGVPCVNLFNARDPGPAYQLGLFQNEEARGYLLDLPGGGVVLVLVGGRRRATGRHPAFCRTRRPRLVRIHRTGLLPFS